MHKLTQEILEQTITKRANATHKGDYGRILIIGGTEQYGGAVIMNALAAVNSGSGLVTVATHPSNFTALHSHLPEAMVTDYTQDLTAFITKADVVLIGSGLGEQLAILTATLNSVRSDQILILDGSALTLLAEHQLDLPDARIVLTPHEMEWQRLSQIEIAEQTPAKNLAALATFKPSPILVLKKYQTEIYTADQVFQLTIGGPYQATGGMGDTLAGIIAGFSGQFRTSLEQAVLAAVYVHSAIADDLARERYVVLPTQISAEIPKLMHDYANKKLTNL
ncbi:NAD(P)H-hydrate dehydratase [Lactococcus raffinolactis]|uniref:NAD(P)H-hydrate dehydratase n=1 Tax=Pseudolactococcus raffinolactis TaxID=1366 RepID=UPI00077B8FB0|nr:NAD(P)H-hydrate dehydratase [Lactococcus raffinolactis]HBZ60150.1 NAD(P)H-hydrate dehydratase [Lactococcus sp.]MDN5413550.1 NAD(P)H-hydrate dehydratase [Lactococcus raffinolactis]MDN5467520.1 NAD(P)H-hydrate dehydratase [Lactococcus raffinolactis]MDT2766717.1 NAD(P)H-hydrate dehydratase [Lactococcus raffinolactis]MDT2789897.1 NAD(P)H-hydrate dehydratase [Lactococcus raffinolactis]